MSVHCSSCWNFGLFNFLFERNHSISQHWWSNQSHKCLRRQNKATQVNCEALYSEVAVFTISHPHVLAELFYEKLNYELGFICSAHSANITFFEMALVLKRLPTSGLATKRFKNLKINYMVNIDYHKYKLTCLNSRIQG